MMYEQTQESSQTARLEDYLRAIRAHPLLIAATVLVFLALGWTLADRRTPTYEASAAVALGPTPVGSANNNLSTPSVERESEILASSGVASAVMERLGIAGSPAALLADLDVEFVPQSDVLQVSYTDQDPERASAVVNGFAEVYTERREQAAVEFYSSQIAALDDQLTAITAEVEALTRQRTDLINQRQGLPDDASQAVIDDLDAQVTVAQTSLNNLTNQLRDLQRVRGEAGRQLSTRQVTAEAIRLSDPPTTPTGISAGLLTAAFGVLGLVTGVAGAFLLERLNTTARDERSVSLALGAQVLGQIPPFPWGNRSGQAALVMLSEKSSVRMHEAKESYRRLRSAVQFLAPTIGATSDDTLVLVITSAHPGEGKSTTSANVAVALAQSSKRVVVLSADLRRPTIEQFFPVDGHIGLAEFLAGGQEEDAIVLPSAVDNLWVVPSGSHRGDPSELLDNPSFEGLLKELRGQVDFVLIDTPPVLSTADALVVGKAADGVVVVVDSKTTDTQELLQVRAEMERSGLRLLGAVLNRDGARRGSRFKRRRYAYASGSR